MGNNTEHERVFHFVGFEVFTVVVIKNSFFWDITPCSPLKVKRRFRGISHLHLQVLRIKPSEKPS
jgi:hypothetical protein